MKEEGWFKMDKSSVSGLQTAHLKTLSLTFQYGQTGLSSLKELSQGIVSYFDHRQNYL